MSEVLSYINQHKTAYAHGNTGNLVPGKLLFVKKITHKQQADGKKSALHNKARAYLPASRLKSAV